MKAQTLRAVDGERVISFYPGCSLTSSGREMMESYLEVASFFGLRVQTLEDWSCCGSTPAHSIRGWWGLVLPARNLLLAESRGIEELMTLCPSCFVRLWDSREKLLADEQKNKRIQDLWGAAVRGHTRPVFFLESLLAVALEKVETLAPGSFRGLRIAPYYGCLLSRQRWVTGLDGHSPRTALGDLLKRLEAQDLKWGLEEQCCGAGLAVTKPELSQRLVARIHQYARRAGANCLVVFCPLCHMNLELRAPSQEALPVLYFTELLAIAAGLPHTQHWLGRHLVDPKPLLSQLRIA